MASSAQLFLLSLVVMAATGAPQFEVDSVQQPTPYDFAYGVNVPDTGDAKEHKESVSPSGRTEGEYRWLQPNGLYLVVRYFVDGDSGFQADVNELPGEEISNYYTNSIGQQSSSGIVPTQDIDLRFQSSPSNVNVFSAPQPSPSTFQSSGNRRQSFGIQKSLSSQEGFFANVIDGGVIDGGIIDGGIIDGGIIN